MRHFLNLLPIWILGAFWLISPSSVSLFHNFYFSFSLCSLSCMFWFFPSPSFLLGTIFLLSVLLYQILLTPPFKPFSSLCSLFLMILARACRRGSSQGILWSVNSVSEQRCASCVFSSSTIQRQMCTHKHRYTALLSRDCLWSGLLTKYTSGACSLSVCRSMCLSVYVSVSLSLGLCVCLSTMSVCL